MAVSKLSAKQPWTAVWTPGVNLVNFYNLYDSKGDVTISAATSIPTTLDGPIQVARYGALTVNAALTAAQRCRGLIPLCDSLTVGAAGSISMTARGAAGAKNWAVDKDIFVPQSITFSGKNTSYADFLKWIRTTGYCIFDPSMYACPPPGMGDVTCDWATWTPYGNTIISAAGCGIGGGPGLGNQSYSHGGVGGTGTAGGTGGGGGGGAAYSGSGCQGGPGRPWGGGAAAASTAQSGCNTGPDPWGGQGGSSVNTGSNYNAMGGGAGNPGGNGSAPGNKGGDGTGGILFCLCRGNATLAAGAVLSANGVQGGSALGSNTSAPGAGSGAGSVALVHGGTLSNAGSMTAVGGAYGPSTANYALGGQGGAGSTQAKSFAAMGWAA